MKIDTFFVWYTFCRNAMRRISTELVIYANQGLKKA